MIRRAGRRRSALLATVLAALLPACGLPVESGVQAPGQVSAESVEQGDIQVLPPGPRLGAGPREVVLGFLGAQTSAENGHALAREFLVPELREQWDDTAGVLVYDPASLEVVTAAGDESSLAVRARALATIAADGSYLLGDGTVVEDTYRVQRAEDGQIRLSSVPAGLRLTPAGAGRSYSAQSVFFLGLADAGRTDQLVPDRVFLPVTDIAGAVVRSLLAGPSAGLRGAAATAVPDGTQLLGIAVDDGVVTVDLSAEVATAAPPDRRRLAAQLVWTTLSALPTASSVRLLVEGRPLDVPGVDEQQDRGDWPEFDPAGPAVRSALLHVRDRRLRALEGAVAPSEATDGRLPVDAVASSPTGGTVALLTRNAGPGGTDVVSTGPPGGPFTRAAVAPRVRSMSWGSGRRGLWLVTGGGAGAAARALLLPTVQGTQSTVLGEPTEVVLPRPAEAGPLAALRVSRDGARVAVVLGDGAGRRLWVGRVEPDGDRVRVAGLRSVAPGLTDVSDAAWISGTELVALGSVGTPGRLPVRVAVDGSEVEPVRTLGLDGEPQSIAAAPGRPLVVGAALADRSVLFVEEGGLFRLKEGTGSAPAYPG